MRITETISLIGKGPFSTSAAWAQVRDEVHSAVELAEWPVGSGSFSIYPESGKKSGMGNGVVPIKAKPMAYLQNADWQLEWPWEVVEAGADRKKGSRPGKIDAAKSLAEGLVVVEWETGNISSSHRAINKIGLGLVTGKCVGGVLVVPNKNLAKFLTDRIGNVEEIRPYFPLWRSLNISEGVLEIIVIEHDRECMNTPKIPKGSDGRAKEGMLAALGRRTSPR